MNRSRSGKWIALLLIALVLAAFGRVSPTGRAEEKADFSRWEKDIAAFERRDRDKPPPKNAVLFVGSSSIRLWDLPKSYRTKPRLVAGTLDFLTTCAPVEAVLSGSS